MNEDRRAEILAAYELHASIFDEVARRRARAAGLVRLMPLAPARVSAELAPIGVPLPRPRLSPRMHEVLTLIAEGHTNDEIGVKLTIGIETVKSHIAHLMSVLDARNRAHVVALGFRLGMLSRTEPEDAGSAGFSNAG